MVRPVTNCQGLTNCRCEKLYRKIKDTELSDFESEISKQDREVGGLFTVDGQKVEQYQGTSTEIIIGRDKINEIRQLSETQPLIFTHNHPHSNQSFSKDDMGWTISNNIAEMRAVGNDYVFILKRPEAGWSEHIGEESNYRASVVVKSAYDRLFFERWEEHVRRFPPIPLDDERRSDFQFMDERQERSEEDITIMHHDILLNLSEEFRLNYERKDR